MFDINTLIILLSIILYGIVFFIQRSQISKQNDLFNKYEKIFNIINIDEIEKYILIQKKSMQLELNNRELEILNNENFLKSKILEVETILNSSKSNMEKTSEVSKRVENILDRSLIHIKKVTELNVLEFKELHDLIEKNLKNENPILFKKIEDEMSSIVNKYDLLKREVPV